MRGKSVTGFLATTVCVLYAAAWGTFAADGSASGSAMTASSQATTSPAITPAAMRRMLAERNIAVAPLVEPAAGGFIDWTSQEFCASGSAKLAGHQSRDFLMAQNAARLIAARNAALLVAGIGVDAGGRFTNVKDAQIQADVILRDYKESDSDYDPKTEMVTSFIRIPFFGLRGVVQLSDVSGAQAKRWAWPDGTAAQKPAELVVIDARECNIQPTLLPVLANENGEIVFAPRDIPAGQLAKRGAAMMASAQKSAGLTGTDILALRVKQVDEKNPACLILDAQSMEKLSAAPWSRLLMAQGQVVIVTSQAGK